MRIRIKENLVSKRYLLFFISILCRYIESTYKNFGIEQKSLENVEQFHERIDVISKDLGKADELLFNDINEDLTSTHNHIKGQ